MRTIRLYGDLATQFGDTFQLDVKSPSEAVRALCILVRGFKKYLLESEKNNVGFKVFEAENQLDEKDLFLFGSAEIKFVPVIGGANAEFRIITGAALVAAGFLVNVLPGGSVLSPILISTGSALILGGVMEMLTPKPKIPQFASSEKPENKPSYVFRGPVTTTAQPAP